MSTTRSIDSTLRVHAPGRVNLIGDHTDYTGGLAFPMAIDRGTTLTGTRIAGRIELTSDAAERRLALPLPFHGSPAEVVPHWGSFIAAMAKEIGASDGVDGHLTSDIPAGAGLSSSAALECAIGLALGFDGAPGRACGDRRPDGHHGSALYRGSRRGPRHHDRLP